MKHLPLPLQYSYTPSVLKHKTTLDIAHFATPSEQQQEYVQFFGDFPREKTRSLVRLDHLLPTFRWRSPRPPGGRLRAPPVCSSGSATGETAGRDTVFCGCGHLGLGGSLHPRPTWWPIDWKACNSRTVDFVSRQKETRERRQPLLGHLCLVMLANGFSA